MIAAATVNPAYWKQMTVNHMLDFCDKLLEANTDYSIPEKLKNPWDEVRFKEAIQSVSNDIGWTPDTQVWIGSDSHSCLK